ncbi:MAG: hypothetical protein Q7R33_08055 [Nitrosarchaeum sp.]|nr:hypothetical protein [Nitrosarchaeum sp.]
MSRSYREPWFTDGYKGSKRVQFYKNLANRVVRRTQDDIPNGKFYRKLMERWDIRDYRWLYNPKPRICYRRGKVQIIEPSPIWRVNRK